MGPLEVMIYMAQADMSAVPSLVVAAMANTVALEEKVGTLVPPLVAVLVVQDNVASGEKAGTA